MFTIGIVRRTLCAGAVVVLATLTAASAQDVSEGTWINLFDGESTYGWTAFGDAAWMVRDGTLVCDTGSGGALVTNASFMDFELTAQMKVSRGGTGALALRAPFEGHPGGGMIVLPAGKDNAFSTIQVKATGGTVTATVNGQPVEISAPTQIGHIALYYQRYHRDKKAPVVELKELKLRPLGMTSLFNGKDLTGWYIIPDRKSVFSVVDGAINIKDGNGQIETEATFRNFLLQIDVFSNGDHLNSGVFFRTPPKQFWLGYESQVRNEWLKDDRSKPVDYGTGGLYGLVPARKVVPSDREWFTKTIVCNGNHMAVWVNGYLVSDFFDTRPPAQNSDGKNGYVDAAGTINLQGHDPTTDLSFKNIHIQQYPN
ncbi:MAG TPA: DUF1080 domain-containing protein [Candidatus Hydrogenedentes bacterium]|nr:DUF1080 domain-containing protein [Candidatus Hydrogenedentota bacterium]